MSLKSLVLANDTATSELRELNQSSTEESGSPSSQETRNPGPLAMHGIWKILPNSQPVANSSAERKQLPATTPGFKDLPEMDSINMPPGSAYKDIYPDNAPGLCPSSNISNRDLPPPITPQFQETPLRVVSPIGMAQASSSDHHELIWGQIDKLELALKKLETARWELERTKTNIAMRRHEENAEKQLSLLRNLQYGLEWFGMSTEQITWATNSLFDLNQGFAKRQEVKYTVCRSNLSHESLQNCGVAFEPVKVMPSVAPQILPANHHVLQSGLLHNQAMGL